MTHQPDCGRRPPILPSRRFLSGDKPVSVVTYRD